MTVDGTDFRICEQTPFSSSWFSHKFKGPAYRYEIALAIQSDRICWTNGPYRAGAWPDMKIFRRGGLMKKLPQGERVEADKGYRGEKLKVDLPHECTSGDPLQRRSKARVRARHESMNRMLKRFKCLHEVYCHDLVKHQTVFRAVVYVTQIALQNGSSLMKVNYKTMELKRSGV